MTDLLKVVQELGGFTTLSFGTVMVLILYGGYKRIWVWGYQLDKVQKEADEWKDAALRSSGLAQTSLSIAKDKDAR